MNDVREAFTLLELLVVMAIMALMTTASVASYRAMQQGMQDSAVVRNTSQFLRLAYQRSKIDRVPVSVYCWNETHRQETDNAAVSVNGRAVAVRRHGRVTAVDGKMLLDEFGDLDVFAYRNEDGEIDNSSRYYENDAGMYLYRINGNETGFSDGRSKVSRTSASASVGNIFMISYPETEEKKMDIYGFYVQDGSENRWAKGDAYGLEFSEFEMPNRYIFKRDYSESETAPVREIKVIHFDPLQDSGGGQTIEISAIRPGASGAPEAVSLGETTAPNEQQQVQND